MNGLSDMEMLREEETHGERRMERPGALKYEVAPGSLTHAQQLFMQGLDELLKQVESLGEDDAGKQALQAVLQQHGEVISDALSWLTKQIKNADSDRLPLLDVLKTKSDEIDHLEQWILGQETLGYDVDSDRLKLKRGNRMVSFIYFYDKALRHARANKDQKKPIDLLLYALRLFQDGSSQL